LQDKGNSGGKGTDALPPGLSAGGGGGASTAGAAGNLHQVEEMEPMELMLHLILVLRLNKFLFQMLDHMDLLASGIFAGGFEDVVEVHYLKEQGGDGGGGDARIGTGPNSVMEGCNNYWRWRRWWRKTNRLPQDWKYKQEEQAVQVSLS
jgi:hypothetical protein